MTGLINTIYGAAQSVGDFRTLQFYDWFVKEQGEEEKNAEGLIKKFQLFGHDVDQFFDKNRITPVEIPE